MAVTKLKAYHSASAIRNTVDYVMEEQKTRMSPENPDAKGWEVMQNAVHYATNQSKTTYISEDGHTEILVSGHHCLPDMAEEAFQRTADTYHRNGHKENAGRHYRVKTLLRAKLDTTGNPIRDSSGNLIHDEKAPIYHDENGDTVEFMQERINKARSCYMWVMAFPPPSVCGYEIDARLIHQIGIEFMQGLEQAQGLEFPAIIASHTDKEHRHNHIVMSAFSLDGHHKYLDTMDTLKMARDISDRLSKKYDLPIIFSPENSKSMSHDEWKLVQQGKSWKQSIRNEIAYNLERAGSYEDFLLKMHQSGYTVRETEKSLTYYTPRKDHRCRDVGLGKEYTKASILEYFKEPEHRLVYPTEAIELPPTQSSPSIKLYVSRFANSGRRRTELEILLLKAIKLIQYFKDKFADVDSGNNPIRKSASWKTARLSETIGILSAYGIATKEELKNRLNTVGAEYSHLRKDYQDIAQSKDGLEHIADLLVNFQELQKEMESAGITDTCLLPATEKDISARKALLFPMTPSQRRELYLALQDAPQYQLTRKFDHVTYSEAKECIQFLKGNSSDIPKLLTSKDAPPDNAEAKFQAIAYKLMAALKENAQERSVSDRFLQYVHNLQPGIDLTGLTFHEAIHLAAYYKPWNPAYVPAKNLSLLVTKPKAKQLSELLLYLGKEINIPVEQLSKEDAASLFRDLVLSMIPPERVRISLDATFEANLSGLDYELREAAHEWRNVCRAIHELGYDTTNPKKVLSMVRAQLDSIYTEERKLKAKAQEYKTLKQLDVFITLSEDKRFTYGSKWQEAFSADVSVEETEQPNPKEPDFIPAKTHHFSHDTDMDI